MTASYEVLNKTVNKVSGIDCVSEKPSEIVPGEFLLRFQKDISSAEPVLFIILLLKLIINLLIYLSTTTFLSLSPRTEAIS